MSVAVQTERRRTSDELDQAAQQVLLLLRMGVDTVAKGNAFHKRWSRATLCLTQGWDFEDRVEVWQRVLYYENHKRHLTRDRRCDITETDRSDLRSRIEVYGEDGGWR